MINWKDQLQDALKEAERYPSFDNRKTREFLRRLDKLSKEGRVLIDTRPKPKLSFHTPLNK